MQFKCFCVLSCRAEMLAWLSVWGEVQICIWPSWCHCHSLSLAWVKARLVLRFWYQLTRIIQTKCIYVCVHAEILVRWGGNINQFFLT